MNPAARALHHASEGIPRHATEIRMHPSRSGRGSAIIAASVCCRECPSDYTDTEIMSQPDEIPALLETAIRLARMGGNIAADRLGQARTTRKRDRSFVTQVDFEIQDALLDALAEQFPGHAAIVEEDVSRPDRHAPVDEAEFCWVIDPLDGTRNFSRGFPVFSTSVAVMREGRPIVGVVCHANTGQVFAASVGGGATLDGRPTHVRDEPPTSDTMVFMRGRSDHPAPPMMHRWLDLFSFRNIGSTALHMAFVAGGIVDVAFHQQCKLWDLAAGSLLVTEAGGMATQPNGDDLFPICLDEYDNDDMGFLAAGLSLHAHLLADARESNREDSSTDE